MSSEVENPDREVLHLHIGSGGIQVGDHCWQLYCLEHNLNSDGCLLNEKNPPQCFFSESNGNNKKKFGPRALFIDFDSTEMDRLKTSNLKDFYNDNQFLLSTDSSHLILDRIRKQIESYDHFQGFILSHSTFGKCSNLTSQLLNNLTKEYSKMTILTNSLFGTSINICDMSNLLKNAHVIIPMENESIFNLCKHRLNIETPTYSNINRLIAHCWSNLTCSMRFDGGLLANLNEFQTSLICSPTLKMVSSYLLPLIPILSSKDKNFQSPSVYDMCIPLFCQSNTCFIHQVTPYKIVLATCLLFRGENIIPKEIGQKLICEMKQWIRFSDKVPTGFRCGINYHRPYLFNEQSDIAQTDKQVLMLTNETSTSKHLCQMALNQSTKDYQEQTEIIEDKNSLEQLINNYEQIEKEIIHDNQLDLTIPFL